MPKSTLFAAQLADGVGTAGTQPRERSLYADALANAALDDGLLVAEPTAFAP